MIRGGGCILPGLAGMVHFSINLTSCKRLSQRFITIPVIHRWRKLFSRGHHHHDPPTHKTGRMLQLGPRRDGSRALPKPPGPSTPPSGTAVPPRRLRPPIPDAQLTRRSQEALSGLCAPAKLQSVPSPVRRQPLRDDGHVPGRRHGQGQCHRPSLWRRSVYPLHGTIHTYMYMPHCTHR